MASFWVPIFNVAVTGQASTQVTHDTVNDGRLTYDTKYIKVTSIITCDVRQDEYFYLGFIQIVTGSLHLYAYGDDYVAQQWEFRTPCSDAPSVQARPWYGMGADSVLPNPNRVTLQSLGKPYNHDVGMTDGFPHKVSLYETPAEGELLPTGKPRPLTRVKLDHSFRIWLAGAEVNATRPDQYVLLRQVDWRYQLEIAVYPSQKKLIWPTELIKDELTYEVKMLNMAELPIEAFNTGPAIHEQELHRYWKGNLRNTVVRRRTPEGMQM
jgi:hypothetical protein